jgi:hypothetical protein
MAWRLGDWLTGRRISVRTVDELGDFVSRLAMFIAQKCVDDYCRGKTGLAYFALSEEKAYREAVAICRWEGFAAVLTGLMVLTQRRLIEAGGDPQAVEATLTRLYARSLDSQPPPEHRPAGWGDLKAALPERLRAGRAEPSPSLVEIADAAAARLFEVLPIHQRYRELDAPVVHGAVQFRFVWFSDRLRREVDTAAIARQLAAAGAPP